MAEVRVKEYRLTIDWDSKGDQAWKTGSGEYLAAVAGEYTDIKRIPEIDSMFFRDNDGRVWSAVTDGMLTYSRTDPGPEPSAIGLKLEALCREAFSCFGLESAAIVLATTLSLDSAVSQRFAELVGAAAKAEFFTRRVKDLLGADVKLSFTLDWGLFTLRFTRNSDAAEQLVRGIARLKDADPAKARALWDKILEAADKLSTLSLTED